MTEVVRRKTMSTAIRWAYRGLQYMGVTYLVVILMGVAAKPPDKTSVIILPSSAASEALVFSE